MMQVTPKKNSPLNNVPAKLPGIDLETDYNDTYAVTTEISQYNAERIQDTRTNSFLILDRNTGSPAGVATSVDET